MPRCCLLTEQTTTAFPVWVRVAKVSPGAVEPFEGVYNRTTIGLMPSQQMNGSGTYLDEIEVSMKQHKKKLGLYRLNVAIPTELHEWLKASAEAQNKSQGLYLTEILELVKKLKDA